MNIIQSHEINKIDARFTLTKYGTVGNDNVTQAPKRFLLGAGEIDDVLVRAVLGQLVPNILFSFIEPLTDVP